MKLYTQSDNNWRNLGSRIMLVILSVMLIVWFLPRTDGPQFRYDVGKPWMYGSLIAQFDFPIYKTDEAIKAEQDSINKYFEPYYNFSTTVEEEQIAKFKDDFREGIAGLSADYITTISQRLHYIYQRGVMRTTEYRKAFSDTTKTVRLVVDKTAQSVGMSSLYSEMSAYEELFADEKLGHQRQLLQRCNLNEYIVPNVIYDKERSETEKNDMLSLIPQASGMVLEGQRIIDRGDIVDSHTYRVLNSFEQAIERRNASEDEVVSTIMGQSLYVLVLMVLFTTYLTLYHKEYFLKPRSLTMLFTMLVIFPVVVSLMMQFNKFSVYLVPFAIAPIFIRVFMDSRTAFNAHVTMVLICAVAVKYQYEFVIVQIVAGLIAIYSLRELERRSQIFLTALLVTLGSMAVYLALQLIQSDDMSKLDASMYIHFAINGFFLLFAYPMMLVIEKTFGFVSTVTLFELSNTNNALLRRMSEVAPGTFQHSIMVGNLGAEIANRIGAKAQLVRTGALYHDIGKLENPAFFTENQAGVNPHSKLTEIESARIIVGHVTEGLKMAEKKNLPAVITDFIRTHHGRGLAKFFYIKYKNAHPDEEVDTAPFSYPGPNPQTREQAILMMADSVEAASRSLSDYSEESISQLVNRIIDSQLAEGFFTDCPITFYDISQAKQVLIERLMSIYHTRIKYPRLKQQNKDETAASEEQ